MLSPAQLLPGEIGVRLDPLAVGVRQCRCAEDLPARFQAFVVTADPVGINGVFVEQAVFVDPIFRDEGIVGTLDQEAALRQIEPLLVALFQSAEPRRAMERLGAVLSRLVRQQVARDHRVLIKAEIGLDAGRAIEADEHLLIPQAERGPLAIGGERLFLVASVVMGLCQVEFVAGNQKWVRLGGERALEQACLLAIMPAPRIARPGAVVSRPDARARKPLLTALIWQDSPTLGLRAAAQEFVQYALIAPRQ